MACAPSEDSDQPGHPPGLIRVLATHWSHSEHSDQTGRMPRLIWVFAWRTCHFVGLVMRRLIHFFLQKLIPETDYYKYEAPGYESSADIPTQNGGLSPRFVHKLRPGGPTPTSADNAEQQFMKVLQKVYQTIERNEIRLQENDRKDIIKHEWQQLALVIDRLLLFVFILVTITVTLVVLVPSEHNTYHKWWKCRVAPVNIRW